MAATTDTYKYQNNTTLSLIAAEKNLSKVLFDLTQDQGMVEHLIQKLADSPGEIKLALGIAVALYDRLKDMVLNGYEFSIFDEYCEWRENRGEHY